MLGQFRTTMIVWLIAVLMIVINLITNMSFSGEFIFFFINAGLIFFAVSITFQKVINH